MVLVFLGNLEYSNDGMQRYVIIRGQVFQWEEKAPFVLSGKSVDGALEYDMRRDAIRCHECGGWYRSLCGHIGTSHHENTRAYKIRHHLSLNTALVSPGMQRMFRTFYKKNGNPAPPISLRSLFTKGHSIRPKIHGNSREMTNEAGCCAAQVIMRIKERAAELGRVPTCEDAGRTMVQVAQRRFGTWNSAIKAAGMEPNVGRFQSGDPRSTPLFSREILVESLIDFYVLNQRLPRSDEWGTGRLASHPTYIRRFGSSLAAYSAAGLGLVYAAQQAATGENRESGQRAVAVP